MKGLNAREALLSETQEHKDFRIEPDFYTAQTSLSHDSYLGDEVIDFVQYGTSDELNEIGDGYPVLRLGEISNGFINEPAKFRPLDESEFESLRIKKGDVLVCRTNGNPKLVGKSAVAMEDTQFAFASYLFRVRPNATKISPECLCAFLNSKIGREEIEKHSIRSNQVNFSPDKIKQIRVPRLSKALRDKIDEAVQSAYEEGEKGKQLYNQAETLLLEALNLQNWQPPQPLTYASTCSAAFAAGRLDAEHFQPQYAALQELLKTKGAFRLGDKTTEPIRRGISPDYVEDGDVIVINSQHVGKVQVEVESNRATNTSLLSSGPQQRGKVKRGDVFLNSTGRDTIGRCQCLLEDAVAVVDNHVAIIRPDASVDPVYLACFLNTQPGQMQTESNWTGSSGQIELRPDVIADYLVWDAPPELQKEIRTLIEASHTARRRAKALLEAAKRAVEIAIESDEATALAHLESVQ